ncbi:hypothetical protein EJ05DRAFT_125888 [Pseudovirgaria hyperparasitica]|uniref:Orc1-like AAA ATPase domain-containing protein n=1 Tax=Pseudovirgaria hyperparasitica TaxID=470096 RepID=A0A6A6VX65_9PEZI|nr:uncharacterized protein EJ05DRAFT_125888 [Pseudovirgaria hyperparasitica]KAF2755192.1 hypothetical protein EJ05DRAFT_125888 [Pseudovirgaria hyperparasitica]
MVVTLNERLPCRTSQIRQLKNLFSVLYTSVRRNVLLTIVQPSYPAPSVLVAYGLECTGKTSVVKGALEDGQTPHAFIVSRECITGRHMLEQTVTACIYAVEATTHTKIDRALYSRCENISALVVHLQQLLQNVPHMTLVFDGVDKQRESPPTLLPALSRMTEFVPKLSVIFIVSVPKPRFLHTVGIPHVHFPPYTKDETIRILSNRDSGDLLEFSEERSHKCSSEDVLTLWTRFLTVLWDSLGKGAARDLGSFTVLAEKLWKPFTEPVLDGTYGPRDFSRIMVSRRGLFQNEDILIDSIIPKATEERSTVTSKLSHALPYYSKYLLCAAYLASFNPARSDAIHFMKSTDKRRRKKGGATSGRIAKNRKIARHLLSPSLFALDRLLAILHSIIPHTIPQTADIYTQVATLASLRLLLRSGASSGDVLDPACKWRVNFGLDYVMTLGRTVGFELSDYLASAD